MEQIRTVWYVTEKIPHTISTKLDEGKELEKNLINWIHSSILGQELSCGCDSKLKMCCIGCFRKKLFQ